MANVNDTTPVTFVFPDGDEAHLETWAGILAKITPFMTAVTTAVTTAISAENTSLSQIDSRIDYWLSQQAPSL